MRTKIQKTAQLGELVTTVFDEAARQGIDSREVSHLATWALANIFRQHDTTIIADNMSAQSPGIRPMRRQSFKLKRIGQGGCTHG